LEMKHLHSFNLPLPIDFGIVRPRLAGTAAIYVLATKISRVIVVNRRSHHSSRLGSLSRVTAA
jgi:hypothetical protein